MPGEARSDLAIPRPAGTGRSRAGLRPSAARRRVRRLLVASLACAALTAGLAPAVAAQDDTLVLRLSARVDTAREGSAGTDEPAKLVLALSRKLGQGERLSVPLRFAGVAPGEVSLTLDGDPRGVTLSDNRVIFSRDARRAILLVHLNGDVSFDSFVAFVPRQTSWLAKERNSNMHIWTSKSVAKNGGVTVPNGHRILNVAHLPVATIAVSQGGSSVNEGDDAAFVVSLDGAWAGPGRRPRLTVDVNDGTSDSRRTVTLQAGATARTFTVPTADDGIAAGDGSVSATLVPAPGYWVGGQGFSATVAVLDDDIPDEALQRSEPQQSEPQQSEIHETSETQVQGQVLISHPGSDDDWVFPQEGRSAATFNYCAELSGAPSASVTLTATASPAIAAAGSLTFGPDDHGRQCFGVKAVPAAANQTDELPRKVTFSHAVTSTDTRFNDISVDDYVVYVSDDDPTTVLLGASDTTATENDAAAGAALTLAIGRAMQKSVVIPAGPEGKLIRDDEFIDVPLRFAGGKLDEDFRLELSGAPAGVTLTANRVRFAALSGGSATLATIKLIALNDSDGTDETISVSIPADATSRPLKTPSDDFISTSHSVANNGGIETTGTATVTIDDDDPPAPPPPPPPVAQFEKIWGGSESEDAGTHDVAVGIDKAQATDLTLSYTLTDKATLGSDYTIDGVTASPASVTIPAGETSVTITVKIVDDTEGERKYEHVRMTLVDGDDYNVGRNHVHSFTIIDDDEVTATKASIHTPMGYVNEGGTMYVTVGLTLPLSTAVTIPVVVTRVTSEAGDHGTISSITVPAGETAALGEIPTYVDGDADDETVKVALGSNLPARVTSGSADSSTFTIKDTD